MTTTWPPLGESSCGGEGAAEHDGRAEEPEVGFGDVDAVDLLGNGAGEVEAGTAEVVRGDILKDAGLGSPGIEVDRGGRRGCCLRQRCS